MLDEISVQCPYCGGRFVTVVDCSAGDQSYVEDCQICCAPINVHLQVNHRWELQDYWVRRDDE